MNKKVLRQFVEQFGKDWECSCKEPFKIGNLEIISESDTALLAHYTCPNCYVEQMLSAAISEEKQMLEEIQTVIETHITADDVLDIRQEVKVMKLPGLRGTFRGRARKTTKQTASSLASSSQKFKK